MSKPKLSNDDYCRASKRLKCEVAAIKAVAQVESAGNGFYDDGFPVILFERHLFRKFTQGRYNQQYPEISGSQGNYGAAGANQRRKFSLAFSLNPSAAMRACSWGKFQILGDNFRVCGYTSVDAFVDAMKESEGKHLDAFVGFVMGNGLTSHLRDKGWASFARGYNGKNYRINNYDGKMANAYAKFKRENIDCSQVSVASPTSPSSGTQFEDATIPATPLDSATVTEPPTPEGTPITQTADTIVNTADISNAPPPEDKTLTAPPKDGATATSTKMVIAGVTVPPVLAAILKAISDGINQGFVNAQDIGTFLLGFLRDNIKWVLLLIGLMIVLLIVKKIIRTVTFWLEMISKMVPKFNNVTVVPAEPEPPTPWYIFWKA